MDIGSLLTDYSGQVTQGDLQIVLSEVIIVSVVIQSIKIIKIYGA